MNQSAISISPLSDLAFIFSCSAYDPNAKLCADQSRWSGTGGRGGGADFCPFLYVLLFRSVEGARLLFITSPAVTAKHRRREVVFHCFRYCYSTAPYVQGCVPFHNLLVLLTADGTGLLFITSLTVIHRNRRTVGRLHRLLLFRRAIGARPLSIASPAIVLCLDRIMRPLGLSHHAPLGWLVQFFKAIYSA